MRRCKNQIAERWGEKQRFIEKREIDKEELKAGRTAGKSLWHGSIDKRGDLFSGDAAWEAGKELEDKKQEELCQIGSGGYTSERV